MSTHKLAKRDLCLCNYKCVIVNSVYISTNYNQVFEGLIFAYLREFNICSSSELFFDSSATR